MPVANVRRRGVGSPEPWRTCGADVFRELGPAGVAEPLDVVAMREMDAAGVAFRL